MLVGDTLAQNVRRHPDRLGLVFEDRRLSWRELNAGANRIANALLKLGAQQGDRLVYPLENSVEFVEIFFGLAKIGVIGAPVMPSSVGREIAHVVDDLNAKFVIHGPQAASAVREVAGARPSVAAVIDMEAYAKITADASADEPDGILDPDADLTIKYTSGTTGAPKGCIRTHRQLLACGIINLFHTPFGDHEIAAINGPMAAGANLAMLSLYVLGGATVVLLPKFDAAALLEAIPRERLSVVHASQSTFTRFTGHPDIFTTDLSSVWQYSGSSPVGANRAGMENVKRNPTWRGGFMCAYASTEAGGRITYLLPDEVERAFAEPAHAGTLESVGREARLCRVAALDEQMQPVPPVEIGLMAVKAPQVFKGYWNNPDETAAQFKDGWFMTGDLIRKDRDGYIYLSGRVRDMVRTGGMNVYPAEIEPVLRAHPKVKDAAIVGVPHPDWGEIVVACVIAEKGTREDEIIAHCRDKLAPYKRPKQVVFVDSFPENQIGKMVKRELRDMLMAKAKKE